MAKKPKFVEEAPVVEVPEAPVASVIGVRGPKGVPLTAIVSLLVQTNPKREGSAAFLRFLNYTDGMTVQNALDAGITTGDLVYDAAHGFISIEGYAAKALPPKAAKEPKAAKAPKAKKAKAPAPTEAALEVDRITEEETID